MDGMDQSEGSRVVTEEASSVVRDGSSGSSAFSGTLNSDTGTGGWSSGPSGDPDRCPQCGRSSTGGGLDQFFGRLGITPEMLDELKAQFQNVDVDEYLNTASEYLKDGTHKAQMYAKENPWKIAAGIAALALGAGLIWSQCHTAPDDEDRARQLELKRALGGRKYRLDEVLRELDVAI